MNKKRNNKGFSLVELIVVVAIMAVLVGVLAPAYLRYVEKSREQKDISAVGEVVQAIKIAAADEDVAKQISAGEVKVTVANDSVPTTGAATATALDTELKAAIGKVKLDSDAIKSGAEIAIKKGSSDELIIDVTCKGSDTTKLDSLDENIPEDEE